MAYKANPFLERRSERTTSDSDFARLFSPKILEKLADNAFDGAVHIFRSPPGAGKTTILRAFTPVSLRTFWSSKHLPDLTETVKYLVSHDVLDPQAGPQMLGITLSCASGYADLPPGAEFGNEGLFRALLDCRVVLRTLRNIGELVGLDSVEGLNRIHLTYDKTAADLKYIPCHENPAELLTWAEKCEQHVYAHLDAFTGHSPKTCPLHVRFESVIWLQSVKFSFDGRIVAPRRLLMIDDLHKLRRKQRNLLIDELTILRPTIPVWLAERTSALGNELLSEGAREGRDLYEYSLEDIWSGNQGGRQFAAFALNILDRRMFLQDIVGTNSFSQFLQAEYSPEEITEKIAQGMEKFTEEAARHKNNVRYSEWLSEAEDLASKNTLESLVEIYVIRILMARDESKKQIALDLALSSQDLKDKDNSQVRGAAEIFINEELKIPYYFGIDRLCALATYNIEELLSLAAALYAGLRAKQVLRKPQLFLSPSEQEKFIVDAAKRKRQFIPKNHTEGTRARRLLDSIGKFCRGKTFQKNAPYAPGVTGIRLSQTEFLRFMSNPKSLGDSGGVLERVLAECVADNLLLLRDSSASTSRESGKIFYLNRTLCACHGLPLQMGGWQDVSARDLIDWMERGYTADPRAKLGMS